MDKSILPIGWKSVKLSEIADKCTAKNRDFTHSLVLTNSAQYGIIPQTEHFDKNIAVDENIDGYFIVNNGEFVYNPRISTTAPCGPIRRNHLGETGIMSPLYTVFKLKNDKINDTYIEYYFLSSAWYDYMKSIANYGARHDRMSITDDNFFAMPVIFPPLSEQQTIAEILTTADKLIAVKERYIAAKQKQKHWLMQNLLTGKIRLQGFSGERKKLKLGEVADRCAAKNRDFTYSLVLTNSAQYGIIPQTEHFDKNIAIDENTDGYFIVNDGEFVYNPRISVTAPCGPIRRNHLGKTGIMSPLYTVFKLKNDIINDIYIEYYFLSSAWYRYMKSIANYGARHDRMSITDDNFFAMPIIFPSLPEQQAIANVLTTADREIELLKKELEQQKQIKKYLMQKLLTGKIRVKGADV